MERTYYERMNWCDRDELAKFLEDNGFACNPSETHNDLKDAIVANIEDGTFDGEETMEILGV